MEQRLVTERHKSATIQNEKGILDRKGGGFHTPGAFSIDHLNYILWGDEYVCDQRYEVNRAYLNAYSLMRIASGSMEVFYENQTYILQEGDILFLDFRKAHHYHALSLLTLQQFLIDGAMVDAYYKQLSTQYGYVYTGNSRLSVLFGQLLQELTFPLSNDHRISFLLHEIFGQMAIQEAPEISAPVHKACQYMQQHYSENIQVADVAEHIPLSKSHLNRLFRNELDCTPHEYLVILRIAVAKQLLTDSDLTVEEIGYRTGFQSASHFIRAFKASTRMTPSVFRKSFHLL